jgi:glycosyltransferase involved in cell wall biosynthesis
VGGVAVHVTELAAALARSGQEVHVFTRMAPGQRYHDLIDGVHYQRCPYPGHHEFVDDVNNMCRAFVERVFVVEDMIGPFDVVHAHDWLTANAMIWIKQGRGRRSVLTMHATEWGRCGNVFHNGRSQRVRDQERAGTYWADRVITVSQATKREIAWMYEVPDWKTFVVYNGVSPHRFDGHVDPGEVKRQYQLGPVDPLVLFCGRLEWQKGPDLLVEAIPAVLRSHSDARFIFAGDGAMRGQLENRVRQLGAAHAVRFLGFRSGDELVRLFKSAEVICVPSRNEPFGIVVLEAWSACRPVVVTQSGGPSEYVWHEVNGLKIHPTPDSVTWGLNTLFSDFDRARWMGRNGRSVVENRFTWDRIADQILTVYDPSYGAVSISALAARRAAGRRAAARETLEVAEQAAAAPLAAAPIAKAGRQGSAVA